MQRLAKLLGALVQATRPRGVLVRDAYLNAIDGTPVQRLMAENVKPLPTYADGAFATRPARLAMRRTVGSLFPQTDRLDDRLSQGWAAVASDGPSRALLEAEGLPVSDPGADGAWLRSRGLTWALLRPDRFVFACGRPEDVRAGARAWRRVAAPARVEVTA